MTYLVRSVLAQANPHTLLRKAMAALDSGAVDGSGNPRFSSRVFSSNDSLLRSDRGLFSRGRGGFHMGHFKFVFFMAPQRGVDLRVHDVAGVSGVLTAQKVTDLMTHDHPTHARAKGFPVRVGRDHARFIEAGRDGGGGNDFRAKGVVIQSRVSRRGGSCEGNGPALRRRGHTPVGQRQGVIDFSFRRSSGSPGQGQRGEQDGGQRQDLLHASDRSTNRSIAGAN